MKDKGCKPVVEGKVVTAGKVTKGGVNPTNTSPKPQPLPAPSKPKKNG